MTTHTFDLVVLGGGSGGYAAAIRASELGMTVVLIEKDKVGGTCLHRGCIPTKALLHTAEVADAVRAATSVGVTADLITIDGERARDFRDGIVEQKYKGLQSLLRARGVTVVEGEGLLTSEGRVRVADDVYVGENVILATGAAPRALPGLPVEGRVLTSDQALRLTEVPARVVVLGGGVIGVEFASLWRSLGAEVTIVEALDRLLPAEDRAVSSGLERAFRKRGIAAMLGRRVEAAAQSASEVTVTLDDGTALEGDYLLVAIGRAPSTAAFDEAGLALRGDGYVDVDERLRTSIPSVWAVGDLVLGPQLAHRGFQHGIFVAEEIAGLRPVVVADHLIPRIAYSDPEVASVGVTQSEAEAKHGVDGVVTQEINLAANARSAILGTTGFIKVVRRKDGPVLGVHAIGARVGELITEAQLTVAWEAHPEDVAPYVHAHPTQSEALGEAFLALAGKPLHTI